MTSIGQQPMSRLPKLRVAVVSDLHAFTAPPSTGQPSYFCTTDLDSDDMRHPIRSLKTLIRTDPVLSADVLLCAGDLGNQAEKSGIDAAWRSVHEIGKELKASRIIATVGNHDIDSRYQGSEFDAKGYLQA